MNHCRFLACLLFSTIVLESLAQAPSTSLTRTSLEVAGHDAFVILPAPKTVNDQRPIPWVFYAPTFHEKLPSDRDEGWMIRHWLKQGIAIAGIDIGESYGSPAGRAIYNHFHQALMERFNFSPQACLHARSRGGLMLYCWAVENPEKVRCIAGTYPVCDLTSYPGIEKASPAFEMSASELKNQLSEHNPIPRLARLAEAKVSIFHIHGDQDKVVPLKANSEALANAYRRLGGPMQLKLAPGQWHNMWRGFFECQELVDFIITHATSQE